MTARLVLLAVFLSMAAGIVWLLQDRGQRKAEFDQLETTLKTAATQLTEQRAARVETDRQLASSREQSQRLSRETEQLRQAIAESFDRCVSTAIPSDVSAWVQQYRNHQDSP